MKSRADFKKHEENEKSQKTDIFSDPAKRTLFLILLFLLPPLAILWLILSKLPTTTANTEDTYFRHGFQRLPTTTADIENSFQKSEEFDTYDSSSYYLSCWFWSGLDYGIIDHNSPDFYDIKSKLKD